MSPQLTLTVAFVLQALLMKLHTASSAELSDDEHIIRLLNLTNGGYCKGASPRPINATANVVTVSVDIVKLVDVNMVKQFVKLDNQITMKWTDTRLAWNKFSNPGLPAVKRIYAPVDWLWTPDIIVNQPVEIRTNDYAKTLAQINSKGEVTVRQSFGLTIKCNMKLANFPFDRQQCNYSMSSEIKNKKSLELQVTPSLAIGYSIAFLRGNEYCITGIDSTLDQVYVNYYRVVVVVRFKRLALYYITVLVLPSALILATCIFGFLLPADSGDRLALNVAILLSMSVFLQLAGSITPAQSESIPALTWYFTVAMAVTTLSTIGSIIVHLCYRRAASREAVSSRALRLLFLNRVCGWSAAESEKQADGDPNWANRVRESTSTTSVDSSTPEVSMATTEWRHIGRVIDRLLVAGATAASIGVVIFLFVKGANSDFSACDAAEYA